MADNIWKRFQDAGKKPGKGINPPPKKAKREPVAMSFAIAPPEHVVIFREFLPASSCSALAPRVRDRPNSCASQARLRLCRRTKIQHHRPQVPRRPLAEAGARSRQHLQLSLLDETRAQVCKTPGRFHAQAQQRPEVRRRFQARRPRAPRGPASAFLQASVFAPLATNNNRRRVAHRSPQHQPWWL